MKAVTWQGKHDIQVKEVPGPKIRDPRDIIIRVTTAAICRSDLHIYDGYIPTMEKGGVLGHEFMGVVEEAGPNHALKKDDRVLIPFQIRKTYFIWISSLFATFPRCFALCEDCRDYHITREF